MMKGPYVGSPWRSRFLRAPKLALALAARDDFVELSELASVQLGLKSGADLFFFVHRVASGDPPGPLMLAGLKRGWVGRISRQDLQPAVLNPHELFVGHRRRLTIPRRTEALYLRPRPGAAREELAQYVDLAEKAGINKRKLVRQNASLKRWFNQDRGVITSPWALPYSSGYDYGAWDNRVGAILNGRFVGVDPLPTVDSDLLGAVLNSTFVIASRLLVGTTTGVEGAFDVGPPAAKQIALPDIRRMEKNYIQSIIEVFEHWRAKDTMFAAPSRTAHVDPLRHQLDILVLQALGVGKGEASAQVGALYENYARWRSSVENVESMMRANRREMARNRTGRSVSPIELAGQRVWEELMPDFPSLPASLLMEDDEVELVEVAKNLAFESKQPGLLPGLVALSDGEQEDLGSFDRVRYAAMLLAIGFEPPLRIVADHSKAGAIVAAFEKLQTGLHAEALKRSQAYVKDEDSRRAVAAIVERRWLRACREAGMEA